MSVLSLRADARCLPLRDGVVQTCVTSPPYWGLRDYGLTPSPWGGDPACAHAWGAVLPARPGRGNAPGDTASSTLTNPARQDAVPRATDAGAFCEACGAWLGVLGLEPTPDLYVAHMVEVFREVRRVLRADGTLWLNLGDSYAGSRAGEQGASGEMADRSVAKQRGRVRVGGAASDIVRGKRNAARWGGGNLLSGGDLKPKDLVGIPWMVAFALRADGWWLRSDVVWHKPNPMPESVTDRPTKAHEYLFLLTRSEEYYYDAKAIAEAATGDHARNVTDGVPSAVPGASAHSGLRMQRSGNKSRVLGDERGRPGSHLGSGVPWEGTTRNKRSVTIATKPYAGAHFAVMPEALAEPCVLAGAPPRGVVLDPFGGSGTVGRVAARHGRTAVLCDLNTDYLALQGERTTNVQIDLLTSRGVA